MTTKTKRVNRSSRNQINLTKHPADGVHPHRLHPPAVKTGVIRSTISANSLAEAHRGIDNPEQEEV